MPLAEIELIVLYIRTVYIIHIYIYSLYNKTANCILKKKRKKKKKKPNYKQNKMMKKFFYNKFILGNIKIDKKKQAGREHIRVIILMCFSVVSVAFSYLYLLNKKYIRWSLWVNKML